MLKLIRNTTRQTTTQPAKIAGPETPPPPPARTEEQDIFAALDKSQAVIHFNTEGEILWANDNFLSCTGYRLEEVKGRHHRMFVEDTVASSEEYRQFWENLRTGKFQAAQYRRFGKGGREIWIQATYNPILNEEGKVYKVVKYASDVTNSVVKTKEAFDKVQALIYFDMKGNIQDANENFLTCTGYRLEEIKGRHHRMFCDRDYAQSPEYATFWEALNRGEIQTGEFQRYGREGREIWLNASYTVRFDNEGKPNQVVKYATDITQQKQNHLRTGEAVESISVATQELSKAITDISSSMVTTRDSAYAVQTQADSANQQTENLLASAVAMGDMLALIENISDQINLLALNAAIEAARAGEAGRGFAVVADEVKRLASQAGESSTKIDTEIKGIQNSIQGVAESLSAIKNTVSDVVEMTNTVAAAVEEQSATTYQISGSVQEVNNILNHGTSGKEATHNTSNVVPYQQQRRAA